jgi:hypothetical protein
VTGRSLKAMHDLLRCNRRGKTGKEMHVVRSNMKLEQFSLQCRDQTREDLYKTIANPACEHWSPVLGTPDEVIIDVIYCVSGLFVHSKL